MVTQLGAGTATGQLIRWDGTSWVTFDPNASATKMYLSQTSGSLSYSAIGASDLPAAIDATKIADGSVTNAEFQYIGGLTSDVQSQITTHGTSTTGIHGVSTGTIAKVSDIASDSNLSVAAQAAITASHARSHTMAGASDHSDWPSGLDVTELGYLNGVTGSLQGQIDGKLATSHGTSITGVHGIGSGTIASTADITAHGTLVTGVHGAGAGTLATTTDVTSHGTLVTGVHGAGAGTIETTTGAQSKVDVHGTFITATHGLGIGTFESTTGSQDKVNSHSNLVTNIHGAGAGTLATTLNITNHGTLITGIHGAGSGTLETTSGAQGKVDTHGTLITGIHGVGAGTVAKTSDITNATILSGWGGTLSGGTVNASVGTFSTALSTAVGGTGLTHDDWLTKSADTIIFKDGSNFKAINGTTGVVLSTNTDATVVINAAILALTSGGKIFLQGATTYTLASCISSQNIDNIILEGAGWSTILKINNAVDDDVIRLGAGTAGVDGWVIRNLQIDGNKANCSGANDGIAIGWRDEVSSNNIKIQNCYIHDCDEYGVAVSHPLETSPICKKIIVEDCYFVDNGWNGVSLHSQAEECEISHNHVTGSSDVGITCYGRRNNIHHNVVYNNDATDGDSVTKIGIALEAGHGYECSGNLINNNHVFEDHVEGISIQNSALIHDNAVEGNYIFDSIAGITVGALATHNKINVNVLKDISDQAISLNGSYNTVENNKITQLSAEVTVTEYKGCIRVAGSYNNILGNSCFYDGALILAGVLAVGASNCVIRGNNIVGMPWTGINLQTNSDSNTLEENRIVGCGAAASGGAIILDASTENSNIIRFNEVTGNTGTTIQDAGTGSVVKLNQGYTTEILSGSDITSGTITVPVVASTVRGTTSGSFAAGTFNGVVIGGTASIPNISGTVTVPTIVVTTSGSLAAITTSGTSLVTNLNADQVDTLHATSFLLTDGTRGLSGTWNAGSAITASSFLGSGGGTLSGGTVNADKVVGLTSGSFAAIVTSGTAVVTNLNADKLDGNEATAFSPAAGTASIVTVGTIASGHWHGDVIDSSKTPQAITMLTGCGGWSFGANTTSYVGPGASSVSTGTEANHQVTCGKAGSIGRLRFYVDENTITGGVGGATVTVRVGGADSIVTFAIGSAATGAFTDNVHYAAVSIGTLLTYKIITGGTSGALSVRTMQCDVV